MKPLKVTDHEKSPKVLCQILYLLSAVVLSATILMCRTTDKVAQVCEQGDRDCTMTCMQSPPWQVNSNYPNSSSAYQVAGSCEQSCENNYQHCLQRRENRLIHFVAAGAEYYR